VELSKKKLWKKSGDWDIISLMQKYNANEHTKKEQGENNHEI